MTGLRDSSDPTLAGVTSRPFALDDPQSIDRFVRDTARTLRGASALLDDIAAPTTLAFFDEVIAGAEAEGSDAFTWSFLNERRWPTAVAGLFLANLATRLMERD